MRTNILILIIGLCASLVKAAAPELPQEFVIGLSPFQSPAECARQQALLERFLLTDCPNGSHVVMWDAWELRVIFDVQLPMLAYDSASARAQRVAPAFGALQRWYDKMAKNQPSAELSNTDAIKIPEWLQAATAQPATKHRTVVILASPFCLSPDEPTFSMIEIRYPGDGHLARTSAQSIYGIADKRGRLADTVVLWAYPSESIWASENHRECVTRWWDLFIAGQGGVMAAFSSDTPEILRAATRSNHQAIGEFAVNQNDSALLMHSAMPREVPLQIQQVQTTVPPKPLPVPVVKTMPPPAPPQPKPVAQPMEIKPAPAPPPPKPVAQPKEIKPVPVFFDVVVDDQSNRPVVNLDKSDFSLCEDGVPQKIAFFSRERTPISTTLLIDTSGSISAKLGRIRAAALSIIHQGLPQDEFCIMRFTEDATVVQDFTTNTALLELALSRLKAGGETALLDAVKASVEHTDERGKYDRKAIFLVTDGDENDSRCSREAVLSALKASNVQLYAIGFPDGLDADRSTDPRGAHLRNTGQTESRARNLLDELARVSGGRAFFPKEATELNGIAGSVVLELSTQYRLGYYPIRGDRDGSWRQVQVKVNPIQGGNVPIARTRAGYFAQKTP